MPSAVAKPDAAAALPPASSLRYMPGLDVMRGIAIAMVLVYHGVASHVDIFQAYGSPAVQMVGEALQFGSKGVHLFFVLSGFLITGILVDSKNTSDYYRNFYIRRALRIVPAYLIMLAVLKLTNSISWPYLAVCLLYFCNMSAIFHTQPEYGPLWSLSVEEQFYLVWPIAVRNLSRRSLWILSFSMLAFVPVLRFALLYGPGMLHDISYKTWAVADFFAAGSVLALAVRMPELHATLRRAVPVLFAVGILLLVFVLATDREQPGVRGNMLKAIWIEPWLFLFSGGILVAFLYPSIAKYLVSRPLIFLANISYGLYLCHQFLFNLVDQQWVIHPYSPMGPVLEMTARFLVEATIAITVAWISRRTVEEYFLRKKPKHDKVRSS